MEIEKIIYETTRSIYSVEDKLSIATIFLFCWNIDNKTFAELLYCDDHKAFVDKLNVDYSKYDVDFTIRLSDRNVSECFYKTLEAVKEKYDSEKYYKALFERDEFALVIYNITQMDLSDLKLRKLAKNISEQLSLF